MPLTTRHRDGRRLDSTDDTVWAEVHKAGYLGLFCPECDYAMHAVAGAESRELLDAVAQVDKVNGRCRDCRGGPVWPIPDLATAPRVQWAAEDATTAAEREAKAREAQRHRAVDWPVERIRALMAERP